MKTIGIDCRLAGSKHAGIGRYIQEIVTRVTLDPDINWVLFLHDADQITLQRQANIKFVIGPITHYSIAEQLQMPGIFSKERLDLLHVPHYNVPLGYRGKFVVTIHDLLWHAEQRSEATTLSPLKHFVKYEAYKRVVAHAVNASSKIIVPSLEVKKEIVHHFPKVVAQKIVPVYEGVGEKFTDSRLQTTEKTQSKILFYTGSLYPHKNVMLIVKALQKLPGYELYISSSRSVFVENFLKQVADLGMSERVHHLGRLSDEELVHWYKKSTALIQPSFSEGFGLTGIEAMAIGLPVLTSDIPVFHEVYDDASLYFDPNSPESLASAVMKLDASDRFAIISKSLTQASKYSWDACADQILSLYTSVL